MLDPLVAAPVLVPTRSLVEHYNPWPRFFEVIRKAVDLSSDLPQIDEAWDKVQIVEYQNAMLEAMGVAVTMRSLTETLGGVIDLTLKDLASDLPEFPLDEHRATFRRLLQFRAEVLDGGALFEDALTPKPKLQSFARQFVPAVAVGSVSSSGRPPSNGLDVDLQIANFVHMRDVICEFVTGDNECADKGPPRTCAAPVHDLCDGLKAHDGVVRCLRAQTIRRLSDAVGAKTLSWSSAEAPRYRYV
jgi:hypothetical protein